MVHRVVHSHHPYVVLRGKTYYFRFALPFSHRLICPSLPVEIKRSLRTDSFTEAVYLVNQKLPLIKTLQLCTDEALIKRLWLQLGDFSQQIKGWVGKQLRRFSEEAPEPSMIPSAIPVSKKPSTPKLSAVWQDFVQWKSWNDKRTKDNQRLFDNLRFFLGDAPVGEVSKAGLKAALASISKLPQRNKRRYKDVPLVRLVRMQIPEEDRVAGKYVKEHLKLAQSFFSRYLVKEVDVLTVSPTDGLSLDVQDQRFASLTDSQVRMALSRADRKPEWFQWLLKLAVYSGARRSELAALRQSDFKWCPDTQRFYFVVRAGKTKAAARQVPIHGTLIEQGLMAWIGEGDKRVFPIAFSTPNRVTENFGALLDEKVNDLEERVVFHSVRHTFITKARAAGISSVLVQQVVGHEKRGAGITDRYTHRFGMKDVLPVVDVVRY